MRNFSKRRRQTAELAITCPACSYAMNVVRKECPHCGGELPPPAKVSRAKPKHYEDAHQMALFQWADKAKATMPDLRKLYHVPNGGARSEFEGARFKAMGVVSGVLDLNLDVARGGYFGLRIELKATKAELGRKPTVSPEQQRRIAELREDGYYADVAEGWDEARETITHYLSLPPTAQGMVAN